MNAVAVTRKGAMNERALGLSGRGLDADAITGIVADDAVSDV